MKKLKGCNEKGLPIGQYHAGAKLSDFDVDLMRELREDFGYSYRRLADHFGCSIRTVRDIVSYTTRCQYPVVWKGEHNEQEEPDNS